MSDTIFGRRLEDFPEEARAEVAKTIAATLPALRLCEMFIEQREISATEVRYHVLFLMTKLIRKVSLRQEYLCNLIEVVESEGKIDDSEVESINLELLDSTKTIANLRVALRIYIQWQLPLAHIYPTNVVLSLAATMIQELKNGGENSEHIKNVILTAWGTTPNQRPRMTRIILR